MLEISVRLPGRVEGRRGKDFEVSIEIGVGPLYLAHSTHSSLKAQVFGSLEVHGCDPEVLPRKLQELRPALLIGKNRVNNVLRIALSRNSLS